MAALERPNARSEVFKLTSEDAELLDLLVEAVLRRTNLFNDLSSITTRSTGISKCCSSGPLLLSLFDGKLFFGVLDVIDDVS